MKAIKAIGLVLAVMLGIVVVLGAALEKFDPESTPVASERSKLGASELVCVAHLTLTPKRGNGNWNNDCENIYIGMTPTDIRAILGEPLPVDRDTLANGTVEYWRYFGAVQHDQYVSLMFTNGRLSVIQSKR